MKCRNSLFLIAVTGAFGFSSPMSHSAVVTTADNNSPPNDGETSLLEALTAVQDNEVISFNIPGEGPHYIVTPVGGYPLIEKKGVVIDGYTQPGSAPNTSPPDAPKNAVIKIVLDSRTEEPNTRRTILDFPGFGLSESAVLGFKDAPDAFVRGLAFIGVSGQDNEEDAHVYCIALVGESPRAKIQGCWFGLDPGRPDWKPGPDGVVPGVYGARAAVASFKWDDRSSAGLIFGTDGDGNGDRGEGNVCVAQRLAVHLQTPDAVVAGNWINFFPDGSLLDLEKQGLELEDGTLEALENGDGTNMRVGTNGDGVSDAEEGNRFGPVVYNTFLEFWRPATGIVVAGNTAGFDLDGMPAFTTPGSHFITLRSGSSIRVGTDADGSPGDALEGNRVYGLGMPMLRMNGITRVSFRGNTLTGNYGAAPLDDGAGVAFEDQFADALNDPFEDRAVRLDASATSTAVVAGTVPAPLFGNLAPALDLYLADPFSLYEGYVQGRKRLGSFQVDGPGDLDPAPNAFRFDISALNLSEEDVALLTATATYTLPSDETVTLNFSDPLRPVSRPPELGGVSLAREGAGLKLSWTGGTGPFRIYSADSPAGPWVSLPGVVNARSAELPLDAAAKPRLFYRVKEGALP